MSGGVPCTVLVVAKAPVPGFAKTRLAATLGDEAAADLAAASLLDTLDAVASSSATARVVAMTGDLDRASRSDAIRARLADFVVVDQRGDAFGDRLAHAHADAAAASGLPVLQIGMDTPQVTAALLDECATTLLASEAVLGMASDGGWWVLGVHDPVTANALRDVPMSRDDTGALTLAALEATGLDVALVATLTDLDTIDDLDAVRRECTSGTRFSRLAPAGGA